MISIIRANLTSMTRVDLPKMTVKMQTLQTMMRMMIFHHPKKDQVPNLKMLSKEINLRISHTILQLMSMTPRRLSQTKKTMRSTWMMYNPTMQLPCKSNKGKNKLDNNLKRQLHKGRQQHKEMMMKKPRMIRKFQVLITQLNMQIFKLLKTSRISLSTSRDINHKR